MWAFALASAASFSTLPLQGNEYAQRWDSLYTFLLWLSIIFFVLVVGAMLIFSIRFRAKPGGKSVQSHGSMALEVFWTVVPTIILMGLFVWGWVLYRDLREIPQDAYEIRVIGKKWAWSFQYDDGRMTSGDVFVPLNKPVKLVMTSDDVLHNFFIPNFRLKRDVVPGAYSTIWFEANVPGRHQVYCAFYCGTAHSGMLANLYVLTPEEWQLFLKGKYKPVDEQASQTLAKAGNPDAGTTESKAGGGEVKFSKLALQGKAITTQKGCIACHKEDSRLIGPPYNQVWGTDRELADGKIVKGDANYIRESIDDPNSKTVKGYPAGTMPSYKGQLEEKDYLAIIEYFKALRSAAN